MPQMFCFQCQQTAGNKGCVRTGVCGKQPETARLQDELVYELIRLAEAVEETGKRTRTAQSLMADGLFTTLTNVNFDDAAIRAFTNRVLAERRSIGRGVYEAVELWKGETDIVSLRSTLLFGMKGMAAYAHHAMRLGYWDEDVGMVQQGAVRAEPRPHRGGVARAAHGIRAGELPVHGASG